MKKYMPKLIIMAALVAKMKSRATDYMDGR